MKRDEEQGSESRRTSAAEISNILLLRLCSLRYLPSQTLSEAALAEEFGVSRTPIRQVLQQLALFGLVESRNGVGTVVTEVNVDRVLDLLNIRMHLALLLPDMVDRKKFARAQERILELEKYAVDRIEERDVQLFATIGLRIHKILVDTIASPEFRRIWEECYYRTCRLSYSIVELDWEFTNQLQIKEIRNLGKVFGSGDPSGLANLYSNSIPEWVVFARGIHAGPPVAKPDESFEQLLNEFSEQS